MTDLSDLIARVEAGKGGDPVTWDESVASGVIAFKDRRQFLADATSPARALLAAILRVKEAVQ